MDHPADFYQRLGISRKATQAEIAKAFRALAKAVHPDAMQSGAEEQSNEFFALNEAYEVLRDPEKRRSYDQQLARYEHPNVANPGGGFKLSRMLAWAAAICVMIGVVVLFFKVITSDGDFEQADKGQETIGSQSAQSDGQQMSQTQVASESQDAQSTTAASQQTGDNSASMTAASQQTSTDKTQTDDMGASNSSETADRSTDASSAAVQETAPQSFEDTILILESAAEKSGDKLAMYRLVSAVLSSHSVPDLTRTLPLVKNDQTRSMIAQRIQELLPRTTETAEQAFVQQPSTQPTQPVQSSEPAKTSKDAARNTQDVVELATGPKSAEKKLRLKPGNGLSQSFFDCPQCPEMVLLPAGNMETPVVNEDGSADKSAVKREVFAKPFAVSKFKITFDNWQACAAAGACSMRHGASAANFTKRPIRNVSWNDAKEYVSWLSLKTGHHYRLLTKAEWDYSARAEDSPENLKARREAWENLEHSNKKNLALPVVSTSDLPNSWGIYSTRGQLLEWVEDCLNRPAADVQARLDETPAKGVAKEACPLRYLRGAQINSSWVEQQTAEPADLRDPLIGFRVARDVVPVPVKAASGREQTVVTGP